MENSSGSTGANGAAVESLAVPPSQTDTQPSASDRTRAAGSPNASTSPPEDPEWDFGDGKKFKRSEALKRHKDLENGMYRSHERAAAVTKKFEALTSSLTKFGITAEEFLQDPDAHMSRAAQALIARQVDESLMDPKDLELQRREEALSKRESEIKKADEEKAQRERESRADARAQQIAEEMAPALKASGLPANPKTVARMAEVMSQAYRKGVKLDPSEAAGYVADQLKQEQKWHLDQNDDVESIVELLGPAKLERIRQHLIAQSRKPQQANQPQPRERSTEQPRDQRTKRYIGWEAYTQSKR